MKKIMDGLLVLGVIVSITACNPFKVTDPADPRFDPEKFSFRDNFFNRTAKIDAFRKMFPLGTPKELVDSTLVNSGGAKPMQVHEVASHWLVWRYDEPNLVIGYPGATAHIFIFDQKNKLANIYFSLGEHLYPDQVSFKEIREKYRHQGGNHGR